MHDHGLPDALTPALLDQLADCVVVTDADATILYANAAFERSTGFMLEQVLGKTPRILRSGLHSDHFYRDLWQTLRRGRSFRATFANRDAQGALFHEEKVITPVDARDGTRYYIAISRPVFTDIERPDSLSLERTDPMTCLLSRQAFLGRLENHLREPGSGMLACIDLDHFATINQAFGQEAGDLLLRQVARRLEQVAAGRSFAGRLGGDEFAVLIEARQGDDLRADIAELQQLLDAPFEVGQEAVFLSGSIGACLYPRDARNVSTLLAHAQSASGEARRNGGRQMLFFHPGLDLDHVERLRMGTALRVAHHEQQFRLHFQSQVALGSGDVVAAEALIRWHHPQRGLLQPAQFLDDLEQSAVCGEVGLWVLREACHQFMNWPGTLRKPNRVAVNLSPRHFSSPTLAADIAKILASTSMPPGALEIEITETALMREARRASRILEQLKALGIRIAIDDFATGYSSLSYLMKFPVDALKIPIEFIAPLPRARQAREIVRTIIALAKTLGVSVVAEGVTTEEQASFLQHAGCDLAQGFLYQRPGPLTALAPGGKATSASRV